MTSDALSRDLDHVMHRTARLWPSLAGARIFLTGGTGFFGRWLLESLRRARADGLTDAEVVVLSRGPAAFASRAPHLASDPSIRFHPGDVRTFAFPEGRFTHVIHAAAPIAASSRAEISDGTRRVLALVDDRRIPALLLASSGAVYGRQPPDIPRLEETRSAEGVSGAYAEGKLESETLCLELAQRGVDVRIGRGFAFVGPFLPVDAHFAIGNFLGDALAGRVVRVTGDGTPWRSWLHAADLTIWLWTLLLANAPPSRVFNVGSDESLTIGDAARIVAEVAETGVEIARQPVAGVPAERYLPDVKRAAAELGLETWIPFREAVARTLEFHRQTRNR